MSPSNTTLAPPPLAPIEQPLGWLIGASGRFALALALGAGLARLLRRRHLHWSWGLLALALAALCRPLLAGSAATIALVAAASAAGWSRRWHNADLQAGADLAEIAAERRRPVDLARSAMRALDLRSRSARGADAWRHGDGLIIGCDERDRLVSIPLGGRGGGTHCLIVGATGSGKTVTQTWIAARAIERGMGVVVVDPKGDVGLREQLRDAAFRRDAAFLAWSPDGDSVYNPYAHGSESEVADKVLAGEPFSEPHYLRQAQRYLGHVVRALRRSELEVSLARIVALLDPERLERLVRGLPESVAGPMHAYLDALTPRQRSDLAGVRDRLAILAESDVGQWLDPVSREGDRFDLLEAVHSRAVVYFELDSDSRPLLAQMLGAAVVQDVQTTMAALQGRPIPTLVVIDEFSALAARQVARLFGRARSAGLSLLLATQELADLRLSGHEHLLEQVLGNLSVLIAHRQVVPESADLIASVAGRHGVWRTSQLGDGRTTRTRVRESALCADRVMSLERGWAAVIALSSGHRAQIARLLAATEFAEERRPR